MEIIQPVDRASDTALQDKMSYQTKSPEETERLGENLAQQLSGGDVIALYGDLGSGKTTFIKGVCRALDTEDEVTSPTFTLINEYHGRLPVYHIDCYRIESPVELIQLGCEEYFYGDGICLIEWAERIADYLPKRRIEVRLQHRFHKGLTNDREIVIQKV